ncbi:LysM peptidoglycan-binding domain-containing protein [Pontibacillus yanchengensis]|uniref:LysM peptidoglycan-binding domain-containing protein n=2 Tax=Pontibacillus yanchengensis TaxID=462910 RepID=A0ACC7VI94_9BACI|nr:C40 family peptidase [Pontibacillus yanchengensis]MYL34646.1 LysM peptidoglycan-binding domain-containing protein [Pontibacillus yanchengensis]MYL54513.1 LysM peptidoglycan-binding domain-containing protein [Pontibacillus yanchengensis]
MFNTKGFVKKITLATSIFSLTAWTTTHAETIMVNKGDSLWKLSQEHNTTITQLKQTNQLASTHIYPGQTLTIPAKTSNTYTVQPGDSLWSISQTFNQSIHGIKEANNLHTNTIYSGQTLYLQEKSGVSQDLITTAKQYLGVPYQWGGESPSGFDCSGFLQFVFEEHGLSIPRTVATIYPAGTEIFSPQRGDLVFFETYKEGPSHAGIYLGNDRFIHASSSQGVTISSMNNVYWEPRYIGAKKYY